MIDLANKKIILTGGSRGIGLSILNEIYKLKAKINYRHKPRKIRKRKKTIS